MAILSAKEEVSETMVRHSLSDHIETVDRREGNTAHYICKSADKESLNIKSPKKKVRNLYSHIEHYMHIYSESLNTKPLLCDEKEHETGSEKSFLAEKEEN